jgi:hypothetical protein
MMALLLRALAEGMEARIWFVGLATPERHIARVRARCHECPNGRSR